MLKQNRGASIFEFGLKVVAALGTGWILAVSFLPWAMPVLAWAGFIPLFPALLRSRRKAGFFYIMLAGFTFYAVHGYWLKSFHPLAVPGLAIVFGLGFFTLPLACTWSLWRRHRELAMVAGPALWATSEWSKDSLGYTLSNLGYTQYRCPLLIQSADMTGVYGISFLILFINLFLFYLLEKIFIEKQKCNRLEIICPVAGVVLFIAIILVYGAIKLGFPETGVPLETGIVQTFYDTNEDWAAHQDTHIQGMSEQIHTLARQQPDLIVLPEGAVNAPVSFPAHTSHGENSQLLDWLSEITRSTAAALISGAMETDYIVRTIGQEEYVEIREYNAALVLNADGKLVKVYRKRFLTPFGEFNPLDRWFPQFREVLQESTIANIFERGDDGELITINNHRGTAIKSGILICFEATPFEPARKYVLDGAQVLINITNDYWAHEVTGLYRTLPVAVFRAVENRVPLIRAANAGISCALDSRGRFLDRLPVLATGVIAAGVQAAPAGQKSFYTIWGNVFVLFAASIFLYCLLIVFRSRRYSGLIKAACLPDNDYFDKLLCME